MLDPNKHGVFNKEGYMNDRRLKQVVWLSMFVINALVWYSIFTNGFFITITWLVIVSAIAGIILKLKENRV
tara:strand:- start:259 stop:471 length:213 start_codon:yes stop_codon:yes gene_type:complete